MVSVAMTLPLVALCYAILLPVHRSLPKRTKDRRTKCILRFRRAHMLRTVVFLPREARLPCTVRDRLDRRVGSRPIHVAKVHEIYPPWPLSTSECGAAIWSPSAA